MWISNIDKWRRTFWCILVFVPPFPSSKFILIQSFEIRGWILHGWDIIHFLSTDLPWSLIFELPLHHFVDDQKNNIIQILVPVISFYITNLPVWNTKRRSYLCGKNLLQIWWMKIYLFACVNSCVNSSWSCI